MAKASYHPFLFLLITIIGIIVLGLSGHLVKHFNDIGYPPVAEGNSNYKAVIDFVLFTSVWTTLLGTIVTLFTISNLLPSIFSVFNSLVWLLLTIVFWGASAGLYHDARGAGNHCKGLPFSSYCRQAEAVEAFAWIDFALSIVALVASVHWVGETKRSYRDPYVA